MWPNVARICLTDVGGCKYIITAIFVRSTIKNCNFHTMCPNNISNGAQKIHFFRFKDI
jgi:hypothetical protein